MNTLNSPEALNMNKNGALVLRLYLGERRHVWADD